MQHKYELEKCEHLEKRYNIVVKKSTSADINKSNVQQMRIASWFVAKAENLIGIMIIIIICFANFNFIFI